MVADPALRRGARRAARRGWSAGCATTDDPLLRGPVEPLPGTSLNRPDQCSPDDPVYVVEGAIES